MAYSTVAKIIQESNACGSGRTHKVLAFEAVASVESAGSIYLSIMTELTILGEKTAALVCPWCKKTRCYQERRVCSRTMTEVSTLTPRQHSYCLSLALCLQWYNQSIIPRLQSNVTKRTIV